MLYWVGRGPFSQNPADNTEISEVTPLSSTANGNYLGDQAATCPYAAVCEAVRLESGNRADEGR